jgi:uncharacterized membrane protein
MGDQPRFAQYVFIGAVAIIVLIAAAFRLYGLNWADGQYVHPDERHVVMVLHDRLEVPSRDRLGDLFRPSRSPLNTRSDDPEGNPRPFAYGSLPLLLTLAVAWFGSLMISDLTSYEQIGMVGRSLTALGDIAAVLLTIALAHRAFGRLAAVLAGLLAASTALSIQLTHFFTTDAWATLFAIAVLYGCYRVAEQFSPRWSMATAALGGAALAAKVSVWALAFPILVATYIGARRLAASRPDAFQLAAIRVAISAIPAVLVFAIFEPYALWRPRPFADDILEQWRIVNGQLDVPFTRQFIGTTPVFFEIDNLLRWGLGPGFGLVALVAVGFAFWRAAARQDERYIILLSWIIPYFLVIATSEARFIRYSAPLIPALAILSGDMLARFWDASRDRLHVRLAVGGVIVASLAITVLWATAFTSIYGRDHPYHDASRWIYANVPDGATLTHEVWDDRLPVPIDGMTGEGRFEFLALDMYGDRSNQDALAYVHEFLTDADYIVLATHRVSGSLPRSPSRYPVYIEYYRLLETGQLGYELAFESTNRPRLGPLEIDTRQADESFSVFDHPPVRIYRKIEHLSFGELAVRLAPALDRPWVPARYHDEPSLLLPEPVVDRPAANDLGWSGSITGRSLPAVALWLGILYLLALSMLLPATALFRRFPDAGAGLAMAFGLLVTGYVAWLLWALAVVRFTAVTIAVVLLLVTASTLYAFRAEVSATRLRAWRSLPILFTGQAVFLVTFAVFLGFRAVNPDLWHPVFGGEKPMEIAYIQAVARSESFPPYDPWFADGYINYYYFGFFLVAMLWKVTGIPPEIAFQLTVATLAAMIASISYSIGAALAAAIFRTRRAPPAVGGGLLATIFVLYAGNLHGLRDIARHGELRIDFWGASRAVDHAITEFPYFTYLWGDLHPHVIAAPLFLLVVALGLAWVQRGATSSWGWIAGWALTTALVVGAIAATNSWDAPTAGLLVAAALVTSVVQARTFSWERARRVAFVLPAIAVTAWLLFLPFHALFESAVHGIRWTRTGTGPIELVAQFGLFLVLTVVVGIVATVRLLRVTPLRMERLYVGAGATLAPFVATSLVLSNQVESLTRFLVVGIVLATFGAVVAQLAGGHRDAPGQSWSLLVAIPLLMLMSILAIPRPSGAIMAGLLALAVLAWLNARFHPELRFAALCAAGGFGVVMGTDIVYVADHLRDSVWERMNTVFKFFFHAWPLLALASTAGMLWLARELRRIRPFAPLNGARGRFLEARRISVLVSTALLVPFVIVAIANYPAFATPVRLEQRMNSSPDSPALDGLAWMPGGIIRNRAGEVISYTGDYHAIMWLRENVEHNAVILEAEIGAFVGGGSRISAYTGLPSVLGWGGHQNIQRRADRVATRAAEVRELYWTDDIPRKRYLLRKYRVEYVVIGDVERLTILPGAPDPASGKIEYYASDEGLESFEQMVGTDLEVVFESGTTTLYRVLPFERAGASR